jgi:hypothetical protein
MKVLSSRVVVCGLSLLGTVLVLSSGPPALAGDVLILDRGARSVTRVDASTLAVKATAAMPEAPTRVVLSPDGATVVILCRGEGTDKYAGFKAKTKSHAVFLEAATLKEKARVELGFGIGPALWSPGGTAMVLLAQGFPHEDPETLQAATVVVVDAGGQARRVPLARAAADMVTSGDGAVAAVLLQKVGDERPAQLVLVDVAAGTAGEPFPFEGDPKELLLAPDGDTLYVLSRGKPKNFGGVPSLLAVLSLAKRVKTGDLKLGAITAVGGFDRTGRLVLAAGRVGDVKEARIYVVRGGAVEYGVPGPTYPHLFRFAPDGRTAWILGWESAQVDFGDFSSPHAVTLGRIPSSGDLELTPDGKLALVTEFDGKAISNLNVWDVASGKKLKSFDTASFGSRLGALAGALAEASVLMQAEQQAATRQGRSTYYTTNYLALYGTKTEIPTGKPVVVRPDGKTAFVYDPFGSTVVQLDLEKMAKGKRQSAGSGSRGLFLTGGGKTLLVATEKGLNVYDAVDFGEPVVTKTNGPANLVMGPAGETLLLAKGLVAAVDPATGTVGEKAAFTDPAVGIFLP